MEITRCVNQKTTTIDNDLFMDVELSWESLGFLIFLLSDVSDGHDYYHASIRIRWLCC